VRLDVFYHRMPQPHARWWNLRELSRRRSLTIIVLWLCGATTLRSGAVFENFRNVVARLLAVQGPADRFRSAAGQASVTLRETLRADHPTRQSCTILLSGRP